MSMSLSTEEWEDKIANPDPRVKWAMDVMDTEGQDFEGFLGRVWAPLSAAVFPPVVNWVRNMSNRVPARTNLFPTLALCVPFLFGGHYLR